MVRPLFWVTLSYALGIFLGHYFSYLVLLSLLLIGIVFATWNLAKKREGFLSAGCLLLIFFAAGGMAYNYFLEEARGDIRSYAGERCILVGMVEDEPLWREDEMLFTLRPESVILEGQGHEVSGKVQVRLRLEGAGEEKGEDYENKQGVTLSPFLSYGDRLSLQGNLFEPRGQSNPGGFDHSFFLEARGISVTFYGSVNEVQYLGVSPELSPVKQAALGIKEQMSSVLLSNLPREEGGLLVGMLFGERRALQESTEQSFRATGLSHLLAVSGLHVGLVAALIFLLGKKVGINGSLLYISTAALLFCYVFITGLKPSTLRAFIMFTVGIGAVASGRRKDFPSALAAAAFLTLIYNPLLLFNIGFQLSYAATASIMVFSTSFAKYFNLLLDWITARIKPLFNRINPFNGFSSFSFSSSLPYWPSAVTALISITLSAQLGVLPLVMFYFQEISYIFLLANLLVVPFMSLILGLGIIGGLLGMFLPAAGLLFGYAAYPLLNYLLIVTGYLGSLPFSYREVYPPSSMFLVGWYSLLVFLLAWGNRAFNYVTGFLKKVKPISSFNLLLILLVVSLLLAWAPAWTGPGHLEAVFLDVGQGDAVFIRTPLGRTLLIDGGGNPSHMGDVEEVGERVVVPFLHHKRVKEIDIVLVSHPHEDHYGGLIPVLEEFPVKMLLTNSQEVETESYHRLLQLAERRNVSHKILHRGDVLNLDSAIELRVLHPPEQLLRGTQSDVNNNSLVLELCYGEKGILFTGDIEESAVDYLLEKEKISQKSVLKVPHHGGYLPNITCFLEEASPEIAVITVGSNPFGHPHGETIRALQKEGIIVYRTDHHGAVILRSRGEKWNVETMIPLQGKNLR